MGNEKTNESGKKTCFSYIRYSSLKQKDNTSESRQMEIAPRVAAEKGWHLDEKLNAANLGFSAYSGSNLKTIEGIIKAAESGKIPHGSVMILEALDRLTRIALDDAYQLFRRLLKSGIEIYTERSGRHLTEKELNNPMSVMMTVVEFDAAFQYSDKLSERVCVAWRKKREDLLATGKRLTKRVPGWIDAETWKPIKERVAIVRRIFGLYLEGYGMTKIVRMLNSEKVPTWGSGDWSSAYLSVVLHSKAVIGQFQASKCQMVESKKTGKRYYKRISGGDVIENYFPPIITTDAFYRVQALIGDSKKAVKTEGILNLFQGVAFCTCGQKMFLAGGKNRFYYTCRGKLKGLGCKQPSLRYAPIELVFAELIHMDPELFSQPKMDKGNDLAFLRGRIGTLEKQVENITNAVMQGNATKALVAKQAQLETEIEKLQGDLEIAKSQNNSGHLDTEEREWIVNNLGSLSINLELRRRVNNFCLSNLDRMTFNNKKRTLSITQKNRAPVNIELSKELNAFKIGDEVFEL
jgi:DNA invertase Pin-like site-specific DNA recombinase